MKNFGGVALPIFVALVAVVGPAYLILFVFGLMTSLVAEYVDPAFIGVFQILVQGVVGLVALFGGAFMGGGIVDLALRTARGEKTEFGTVFGGGKYFGAMLIGSLGFYVVYAIGLALCVVPGIIVALGLMPFTFVIVDEKLGGIDALKRAWALTQGHKMGLFLYILLGIAVYIGGLLACVIGVYLVSVPMLIVGQAYIYLKLKGEQPRLMS